MKIFALTLLFMFTIFFLMAIGVMITGRRLKGSCGGLGAIMDESCMFCPKAKECKRAKS